MTQIWIHLKKKTCLLYTHTHTRTNVHIILCKTINIIIYVKMKDNRIAETCKLIVIASYLVHM